MKKFITILALTISIVTNAQDYKRTQNWYFGDKAGLSFATDPPTVLTDGAMSTIEGCATMSDTNGNLLFYTNGITVWNKNHQIMDNGAELYGNESSTQSSLIVPWPKNDSLYYVFTTDGGGLIQKGLCYSLINLRENGGLGKVISKNNILVDVVCEKLTATFHSNGRDVWVLSHGFPNDTFYAYLITDRGLIDCPVITQIGSVHGIPNQIGQIPPTSAQGGMKFNMIGNMIAVSVFSLNKVEIFSFNTTNGLLSNHVTANGVFRPYSLEFSPNSRFLYCIDRGYSLNQFDLSVWDSDSINNSKKVLASHSELTYGQMQLASTGSIYVSRNPPPIFLKDTIGYIIYPDSIHPLCGFAEYGVDIQNDALWGLPNFITSYFYRPVIDFKYQINCDNDIVYFEGKFIDLLPSPLWSIYKSLALIHSSNQSGFSYAFSDTGEYLVRLVSNGDTVEKNIYIEPKLPIKADTVLCNQNEFEINTPANFRCIQWQDGSGDYNYTITESGTYYVSAYNQKGCLVSDTINIFFSSLPEPQISRNGDKLETDSGSFIYQWFYNNLPFDAYKHYLIARNTGEYKVQITDSLGCKSLSKPFNVNSLSKRFRDHEWIKVYPNPSIAGNEIVIESDFLLQSVRAFDITGKEVYRKENIEKQLFHLSLPQQGLYILNINNTFNYKLMIE